MSVLSKIISKVSSSSTRILFQPSPRNSVRLLSACFPRRSTHGRNTLGNELIFNSDVPPISLPNLDVCNAFFPRWLKFGEREALECADTGQKLTYNDLIDISMRWCRKLKDFEVVSSQHEKRISILSPNVLEYFPILIGTLANGWSVNTVSTNYKAGEIRHQLLEVKPRLLVVDPDFEHLAEEALADDIEADIITIGKSNKGRPDIKDILYDKNYPKAKEITKVSPKHEAIILYSSGTTGRPKGVIQPHKSLTNNILSFIHEDYCGGNDSESVMGLLPFYHAFGMFAVLFCCLYRGSKIIVAKGFNPNTFGGNIRKHTIGTLHLVPTLLNFAINSPLVTKEDLASMTGVIITGAPVLPSSAAKFIKKAPKDVFFQEAFGMSEALLTHRSPLKNVKFGSCGKLVPYVSAKIVDPESNHSVRVGERGELVIKGSGVMDRYLNNPIATSETFDSDGWLHTGDIVIRSDDGYFKVVDRLKELIKVKGLQVSPSEVEDILMEHPSVVEAGVVGVPDERVGERIRAYVSVKGPLKEEELVKLVEKKLAAYKQLTGGIRIIPELPKTQTGKILRRELKRMAIEEDR